MHLPTTFRATLPFLYLVYLHLLFQRFARRAQGTSSLVRRTLYSVTDTTDQIVSSVSAGILASGAVDVSVSGVRGVVRPYGVLDGEVWMLYRGPTGGAGASLCVGFHEWAHGIFYYVDVCRCCAIVVNSLDVPSRDGALAFCQTVYTPLIFVLVFIRACVFAGLMLGVAGAVREPFFGLRLGGFAGMATGFFTGWVGLVLRPTYGALMSASQVSGGYMRWRATCFYLLDLRSKACCLSV